MTTTLLTASQGGMWYLGLPAQISAFVALLTALGAIITGLATRRKLQAEGEKTGAEAAKVINDMALELLDPYREQMAQLRKEQTVEAERVHRRMDEQAMETDRRIARFREELRQANEEVVRLRAELAEANRELVVLRAKVRDRG